MRIARFIFGSPIPKSLADEQTLPKMRALAIFSSDALSSVAYATEEILMILVLAGSAGLMYSIHIAFFISILIVIVGFSYKQAIAAYPEGGGAYVVSRENFGPKVGLIAAAALMIDYILTVAVSVSAGIAAVTSAFPSLYEHSVFLAITSIIILTWVNLRGIRESAKAFMFPTYIFVIMIFALIGMGLYKYFHQTLEVMNYAHQTDLIEPMTKVLTIALILKAFSSGCSAMTGIEAISNGVTAFKRPKAQNASQTLTILMILLVSMFLGISFLAYYIKLQPLTDQTVLSQLGHVIFGSGMWYYVLQASTCLILLLAANTSFAGFPLLASMISKDGYLPRQLRNIGDRLGFSNGIIMLGIFACFLIYIFDAQTNLLIPLYSIGVFIAFTLCQAGLVKVWYVRRHKVNSWWFKALINGFGCLCTFVALMVVMISKFETGAWMVIVAIPLLFIFCSKIYSHYKRVDNELAISTDEGLMEASLKSTTRPKVIVPISKLHKGTIAALDFARTLSDEVIPVAVNIDPEKTDKLKKAWKKLNFPEKLVIVDSPYQSMLRPLIRVIRKHDIREPERGLTILVLPKAQTTKWYHVILHNQKSFMLRMALNALSKQENPGETRVVVEVPYQLHR